MRFTLLFTLLMAATVLHAEGDNPLKTINRVDGGEERSAEGEDGDSGNLRVITRLPGPATGDDGEGSGQGGGTLKTISRVSDTTEVSVEDDVSGALTVVSQVKRLFPEVGDSDIRVVYEYYENSDSSDVYIYEITFLLPIEALSEGLDQETLNRRSQALFRALDESYECARAYLSEQTYYFGNAADSARKVQLQNACG